jgi:hypothetical protein
MAQKTLIQLVDDIDGTVIEDGEGETVSFALDGKAYEVDLTAKNADAFRVLFQDYVAVARKTGRAAKVKASTKGGVPTSEVREWAKSNGIDVPDRGRVPQAIHDQFNASR